MRKRILIVILILVFCLFFTQRLSLLKKGAGFTDRASVPKISKQEYSRGNQDIIVLKIKDKRLKKWLEEISRTIESAKKELLSDFCLTDEELNQFFRELEVYQKDLEGLQAVHRLVRIKERFSEDKSYSKKDVNLVFELLFDMEMTGKVIKYRIKKVEDKARLRHLHNIGRTKLVYK